MGLISAGATIFDAGSVSGGGSMTFIKKLTASASATLSFVNGADSVVLDSTYKEYLFTFKDIHPSGDGDSLSVNFRDGSTAYDATKTTTAFLALHKEDDSAASLTYQTGEDLAQSTAFQNIAPGLGGDADQACSGVLHLFNPSSTTFVKHFISRMSSPHHADQIYDVNIAGYCNVTAAIDAVQFKMSSGNIDAGDICLYGIK